MLVCSRGSSCKMYSWIPSLRSNPRCQTWSYQSQMRLYTLCDEAEFSDKSTRLERKCLSYGLRGFMFPIRLSTRCNSLGPLISKKTFTSSAPSQTSQLSLSMVFLLHRFLFSIKSPKPLHNIAEYLLSPSIFPNSSKRHLFRRAVETRPILWSNGSQKKPRQWRSISGDPRRRRCSPSTISTPRMASTST